MFNRGVQATLLLAVALLTSSLFAIRRIYDIVPRGFLRAVWMGLAGLIALSIIGILIFLGINATEGPNHHEDWLVTLMLFGGSVFAVGVSHLSYRTARDVSRIAGLERAATIDPVTELCNRGRIMALLERACYLADRDQKVLSILLLDLDHFKSVNDTYGHPAGDAVLKRFAKLITDCVPDSGLVGRFGGEEFLAILPTMDAGEASVVAERIRSSAEKTVVTSKGASVATPTVSIGIATVSAVEVTAEDLIASADEALYAAKVAGRNRVARSEREPTRMTL